MYSVDVAVIKNNKISEHNSFRTFENNYRFEVSESDMAKDTRKEANKFFERKIKEINPDLSEEDLKKALEDKYYSVIKVKPSIIKEGGTKEMEYDTFSVQSFRSDKK